MPVHMFKQLNFLVNIFFAIFLFFFIVLIVMFSYTPMYLFLAGKHSPFQKDSLTQITGACVTARLSRA